MASLADLIAWRDNLRDARFQGVRRVRDSNGEEVEYRSDAELARALAAVSREVATYNGAANTIHFKTSKGV